MSFLDRFQSGRARSDVADPQDSEWVREGDRYYVFDGEVHEWREWIVPRLELVYVVRTEDGGPVAPESSYLNQIVFENEKVARYQITARQGISEKERQEAERLDVFECELRLLKRCSDEGD